jgi:hypothetical protein
MQEQQPRVLLQIPAGREQCSEECVLESCKSARQIQWQLKKFSSMHNKNDSPLHC